VIYNSLQKPSFSYNLFGGFYFMRKPKDIVGQKFNRLLVLKEVKRRGKNNDVRYFLCRCDCGEEKEICLCSITHGFSKSCGCYHKEWTAVAKTKYWTVLRKSRSEEYTVWRNMQARCYNKKLECYPRYGGKGVYVCERWLNDKDGFVNFLTDMGKRPSNKYSIERKNGHLGYEPDNCVWATIQEQSRNRSTNNWIEYSGKRMVLLDWATYLGVTENAVRRRLKNGEPFNEIHDLYVKKNNINLIL
jgi:hypothetical protein